MAVGQFLGPVALPSCVGRKLGLPTARIAMLGLVCEEKKRLLLVIVDEALKFYPRDAAEARLAVRRVELAREELVRHIAKHQCS